MTRSLAHTLHAPDPKMLALIGYYLRLEGSKQGNLLEDRTVGELMQGRRGDRAAQDEVGRLLGWQDAIAEEAISAGSDKRA